IAHAPPSAVATHAKFSSPDHTRGILASAARADATALSWRSRATAHARLADSFGRARCSTAPARRPHSGEGGPASTGGGSTDATGAAASRAGSADTSGAPASTGAPRRDLHAESAARIVVAMRTAFIG